jgi:hypothetical protein
MTWVPRYLWHLVRKWEDMSYDISPSLEEYVRASLSRTMSPWQIYRLSVTTILILSVINWKKSHASPLKKRMSRKNETKRGESQWKKCFHGSRLFLFLLHTPRTKRWHFFHWLSPFFVLAVINRKKWLDKNLVRKWEISWIISKIG